MKTVNTMRLLPIAIVVLALSVAACSANKPTASGSPTSSQPIESLNPTAPPTGSAGGCSPQPCAVGADGVAVSVSDIARKTSSSGQPVFEFTLHVRNGSQAELGVGPQSYVRLILADHNEVAMSQSDGARSLGLPECYSNDAMGGTDTDIFHLQPGQSLTIPKPLCFRLASGAAAVSSVYFADENQPDPEIVNISS